MKFVKGQKRQFKTKGLKAWVYNSGEEFARASGVYFEVHGSHGRVKIP